MQTVWFLLSVSHIRAILRIPTIIGASIFALILLIKQGQHDLRKSRQIKRYLAEHGAAVRQIIAAQLGDEQARRQANPNPRQHRRRHQYKKALFIGWTLFGIISLGLLYTWVAYAKGAVNLLIALLTSPVTIGIALGILLSASVFALVYSLQTPQQQKMIRRKIKASIKNAFGFFMMFLSMLSLGRTTRSIAKAAGFATRVLHPVFWGAGFMLAIATSIFYIYQNHKKYSTPKLYPMAAKPRKRPIKASDVALAVFNSLDKGSIPILLLWIATSFITAGFPIIVATLATSFFIIVNSSIKHIRNIRKDYGDNIYHHYYHQVTRTPEQLHRKMLLKSASFASILFTSYFWPACVFAPNLGFVVMASAMTSVLGIAVAATFSIALGLVYGFLYAGKQKEKKERADAAIREANEKLAVQQDLEPWMTYRDPRPTYAIVLEQYPAAPSNAPVLKP